MAMEPSDMILTGERNRKPLYTPEETPSIKKNKRLTRTREKQLLKAAGRDINDPPPKPGLGECCGSSCDPCVDDLWREEVRVWRERWGLDFHGNEKEKEKEAKHEEKEECMARKMPGAFEW
ncbi:uncharacterized protein BDV14DRAFT_9620 [Aspergillus stella-maris]|uniref:uncharacterized protein n=1 Tax=Aspergillus stella-maris TaxID=1810926 RepID=UPI003CCD5B58